MIPSREAWVVRAESAEPARLSAITAATAGAAAIINRPLASMVSSVMTTTST
jgi:hypothetical protein